MRALTTGALLILVALPKDAGAFEYEAPDGCPDDAAFSKAVGIRTAHPIPAQTRVRVRPTDEEFVGTLELKRRRRTLTLDTCGEVVEALALSLALQLERDQEPLSPAPTAPLLQPPALLPTQPAAALLPTPVADPPVSARVSRDGWRIEGGLGLAARWGRGRGPQLEPSIFIGTRYVDGWWSMGLRLMAWRSQSGELVTGGPGTAEFSLTGGRIQVCPVGWAFAFGETVRGALHPCATLDVGVLDAAGLLTSGDSDSAPWAASGGTLRFEVQPLDLLTIEAHGGFSAPLGTYRLLFEAPSVTIYEVPSLGGHVGGAIFLQWP